MVQTHILGALVFCFVATLVFFLTTPLAALAKNSDQSLPVGDAVHAAYNDQDISAKAFGCSFTSPMKAVRGCGAFLAYMFMKGAAYVAAWVSVALNIVIKELVVGMGMLVGNMPGVLTAWAVLRDLANIFLVFLTIFVGIATIVGAQSYGGKRMLFSIIIAALFVNFSITLSKGVIDISNYFAISTYKMLINENNDGDTLLGINCANPDEVQKNIAIEDDQCINGGVASVFWSKLQIMTIFNVTEIRDQAGQAADTTDKLIWVGLLGGAMFFVMAFVFGASALLLIVRFTILVFLIVVSPLAFVLWITGVSGQGKRWWKALLNQALFAPALFLCWWISYKVFTGLTNRFNLDGSISGSGMADLGSIAIMTYFFIVITLLITSLFIAKSMGAIGSRMALSTGQRWSKRAGFALGAGAGAVTAGAAAYSARRTVGWSAQKVAESETLKNAQAKGGIAGRLARTTRTGAKGVAGSSFDVRGLSKNAQKYVGKAGGKGGYTERQKQLKKRVHEEEKELREYGGSTAEKKRHDAELRKQRAANEKVKTGDQRALAAQQANDSEKTIKKLEEAARKRQLTDKEQQSLELHRSHIAEMNEAKIALNRREGIEQRLNQDDLAAPGKRMNQEKRELLEKELQLANENARTYYGKIGKPGTGASPLAELNAKLENITTQFKSAEAAGDEARAKTLQDEMVKVKAQQDALIHSIEESDAKARMGRWQDVSSRSSEILNRRTQKATEARSAAQAVAEQQYATENKRKGMERTGEYLDRVGSQRTIPLVGRTPQYRRAAVEEIRSGRNKSEREKLDEQLKKALKEIDTDKTNNTPNENTGNQPEEA